MCEAGNTGDTRVFFVERLRQDEVLGRAHRGKNIRLAGVVAVGANAKVNFALERIGFESFRNTDDRILYIRPGDRSD